MNSQDVILGLLHRRPLSGYEIKGLFEMPLAMFYDTSFGTIYPMLAKMESLGYITKENVIQSNRPNKNVYSITDAGRERFRSYIESPLEKNTFRSDLMVRLYFAEFVGKEKLVEWLRREIEESESELRLMEEHRPRWKKASKSGQLICLNIGYKLSAAKVQALKEELEELQRGSGDAGENEYEIKDGSSQ